MISSSWNLTSLSIFEAVGRLENLTLAARELGMTQPAVSYQIKRMEEGLGIILFARRGRGVEILPEGRILYEAVRAGLVGIDEAIQQIERQRRRPSLRISTDYGFAAFWLMPRVGRFRSRYPEMDVRITASSMIEPLAQKEADISILFGAREDFGKGAVVPFLGESVVPVCSPAFLERHGPFPQGKGLGTASLLHLDSFQGNRWYTWHDLLDSIGDELAENNRGVVFNTYNLVIEAAIAHQGIALGWDGLVDIAIRRGQLVEACDVKIASDKGYWLRFNPEISEASQTLAMELIGMEPSL
ncbi:LysR substrate-binding domain-containing protein [Falsochrobactrum ovis]|uniref:Putative choline sulfate-utilization transcription factor n=1 Tax=Falsochrobactrum ovis TaxID=1293442 RepID=A0A364JRN5_9HYPH|nr:LysR substrate-binding domain-containing protein [Falsochrobactrum ovis]RAK24613.1 putative choline sulfate-utilization transcription factor [Falsochrobactrum ovis]